MDDSHNKAAGKRRPSTAYPWSLDSTPRTDKLWLKMIDYESDKLDDDTNMVLDHARQLERELNVSRAVNLDDCHTDTLCRDAARPVLGDWVDGDNWGVPDLSDIVERLVKEQARVEEWRDMTASEMRLRCGEMSASEIRAVRAVLNQILSENDQIHP